MNFRTKPDALRYLRPGRLSFSEKLLAAPVVFSERVARGGEKDDLQNEYRKVWPSHRKKPTRLDPVANVRSSAGNKHVCVELIMPIVDLNEQGVRFDVQTELRKIKSRDLKAGPAMCRIHDSPPHSAHHHSDSKRGQGEIQKPADSGRIR